MASGRWPGTFGACAVCLLALVLVAQVVPLTIHRSDDYEYASVARNVLRGQGATTQHAYPIDLMLWGRVPHPDFMHPPGLAYAIAGSFAFFGVRDWAAIVPSLVCFVLLGGVVFQLADRVGGRVAAWIAVCLLLWPYRESPLVLATQALSEVPTALCLTAAVLLVWARPASAWGAAAAGLLLGAGALLRENALLCLPGPWMLLWLRLAGQARRQQVRQLLVVSLAAGIAVALLAVRAWTHTGAAWMSYAPVSLQSFTSVYPGLDALRHVELDSLGVFLREHPLVFAAKIAVNVAKAGYLWMTHPPLLLALPIAVLIVPRLTDRRLGLTLAVVLAVQIVALGAFTVVARHLAVFAPLVMVAAACALPAIWARVRWTKVTGVAVAIGAIALVVLTIDPTAPARRDRGALQAWIATRLPQDAVVLSDFPEVVTWHADRVGVWLPARLADVDTLAAGLGVTHLLLTAERTPLWPEWEAVRHRGAGGWRPIGRFDGVPAARLFASETIARREGTR